MKIFGWESKGWSSENKRDNSVIPRNPDCLVILAIQTKVFKQLTKILSYVHKLTHSGTVNRSLTNRTVLEKRLLWAAAAPQEPTRYLPTKQAPPTSAAWPRCRDREEQPSSLWGDQCQNVGSSCIFILQQTQQRTTNHIWRKRETGLFRETWTSWLDMPTRGRPPWLECKEIIPGREKALHSHSARQEPKFDTKVR